MAFSGNFMASSFKQELLQAKHDFTNSSGDTYKLAMYTNSASFNAAKSVRAVVPDRVGVTLVSVPPPAE